ncbi:tetratricopeptide repeat protein [Nocardia alni]|uniref:tetratricopeptide repeat protein n=1 Tax=Nocardia alni TaxID=2815723 RepID=UPI001C2280A3|nr:tetratricopeptide repeat protein [Nocardia alni]
MADIERAKVLIELRRLDEARAQLAAVLAVQPDNAEATTYLAQAAYLDRNFAEAAVQSAAALRIQPRNQFAMRIHALALLNLGPDARRQAQEVARRAVALAPEFAENHRILAIVLRERNNLPEALAVIDRAVQLDPDEADIHLVRGSILRRLGRCGDRLRPGPAAEAYRTALRLEPENAHAVHDLAVVDLNGRRLRSALRGILTAATMDPRLVPLVRTNTATVLRLAMRRVHWALVIIAWLTVVIGFQQAGDDPARDSSYLNTPGRIAGAIGLGGLAVLSAWWVRVVPRRRLRFVLAASWSNPATALRMVVLAVGLLLCLVGVAAGIRASVELALPLLLVSGVILRLRRVS